MCFKKIKSGLNYTAFLLLNILCPGAAAVNDVPRSAAVVTVRPTMTLLCFLGVTDLLSVLQAPPHLHHRCRMKRNSETTTSSR